MATAAGALFHARRLPVMQSSTMSLFEREMRAQVGAAEMALQEAERRGDLLLVEAARGHLSGLQDLARRNGIALSEVAPEPEPV